MRKALSLVLCLAGCGQGDGNAGRAEQSGRPAAPRGPVQTATLTGLYESGGSQVCIVEQSGGARFGLVTREGDRPGCSGAGIVRRRGTNALSLTMDGESACDIQARYDGTGMTFWARVQRGCAYYCAPGAAIRGETFVKTGGTREDALRARDLVGDPLCG